MKVVAIANQKGGVGKTTTAAALSGSISKQGYRVLAIDADPQANLTCGFGINPDDLNTTLYDVLQEKATIREEVIPIAEFYVLPANIDLSAAEVSLSTVVGRERLLAEALEQVESQFDVVIIDCPPSLGILSINALVAATGIIIPCQTEFYSLRGVQKLLETIDIVRRRMNPALELYGVLATMYDARKILHREAFDSLRQAFPDKIFDTPIRSNVALAEAPASGKTIFDYKPSASGVTDYEALTEELLRRIK